MLDRCYSCSRMQPMAIAGATFFVILLLLGSASAAEIDACKYLLVTELAEDPYGIVNELRTQARARGFIVVTSPSEVPDADVFKSCVIVGGWLGGAVSGQLALRALDAVSGAPIAAANIAATNWWGIGRTVRGAVTDVYRQLGFTAYSEDVYQARIQRLYPPRPKVSITEVEVRQRTLRDRLEGIWSDRGEEYRLAILAAPGRSDADYIAIVLQSHTPLWQPGEIKAELRRTDSPTAFTSTYFMLNKRPLTTIFIEEDNVLRATIKTPAGDFEVVLSRVWPAAEAGDSK
jgi:hypothetical protein